MTEEQFKQLSCCAKFMVVNRQLRQACTKNKMIPVLFVASSVSRLYYTMFSTFWVLYLTSFVGTVLDNDEQVSQLYANLMLISMVAAISLSPLVGMFVDRVSPQVCLPLAFMLRASAIGMFSFI